MSFSDSTPTNEEFTGAGVFRSMGTGVKGFISKGTTSISCGELIFFNAGRGAHELYMEAAFDDEGFFVLFPGCKAVSDGTSAPNDDGSIGGTSDIWDVPAVPGTSLEHGSGPSATKGNGDNEGRGVVGDVTFPPDGFKNFDGTPFVLDDNGTSGGGNVVLIVLNAPAGNTRAGRNFGGSVVDGPAIPECNGVTGGRSTIDDKIFALVVGCSPVRGEGSGFDGSAAFVGSGDE
ncbi:uncharacterized protein LOC120897172 isoform X2 [Anopheles arabiensis]|uniref:uncharacterized protein LOC120897172 isoform X2 n=1 Tax=Anopheles arabiensis TaxID=7173 RepID=UPI001AADD866|nr:uncharacterized protein LOC120897172 isoform X2 [Anopheles arabiensis]